MWLLTRKNISDTQSGFRVFRPGIIKHITVKSFGFTIETEITTQIIANGGRVKEVPIHNGTVLRGSYMRTLKDGLKIILTVCRDTFPKKFRPFFNTILVF